MTKIPYKITLSGLLAVLAGAIAFIALIVILPKTSMIVGGEGGALQLFMLLFFGSIITLFMLLTVLVFLPIHIKRRTKGGGFYRYALLLISATAISLSAPLLIGALARAFQYPAVDYGKVLLVAIFLGIFLPFGTIFSGVTVSIIQSLQKKKAAK